MQSLTSNEEQAAFVAEGASEELAQDDGDLVANRLEFFREGKETCEALRLAAKPELEPKACREACERVSAIWAQYQEQPGLMDPSLEEMVEPLIGAIGSAVRLSPRDPASALPNLHLLSSLLYLLTTVRGYKTVSRLFTHEAADLEPCLEAAEAEAEAGRTEAWSTLYCLLLWLGMILLTPFDLQSIDSGGSKTLGTRVYELGLFGLQSTSRVRDASAWMLARYFQRKDVSAGGMLQLFLEWTRGLWKAEGADGGDESKVPEARVAFARCGALQAWNQALKVAPRSALKPLWAQVMGIALRGPSGEAKSDFGSSSVLRKLRVTVCYRAGLVSLPPRLAPWRYMRGARSLLVNFASVVGGALPAEKCSVGGDGVAAVGGGAPASRQGGAAADTAAEEEEQEDGDGDAPEEVEEVIELLLSSLGDPDTVVRWAAAKGIGRLTNRLSRDFGDQVLEFLLERCFSFRETDKAWHGGCLALAELTRRGLLLPDRLQAVVPLVCQALHFEQVSGNHAVGQHVRDAACYVCWAFARAYAPDILEPFVGGIASALIQVAVYDRDINCRRAAAAAVQENVGRQGTFPNGIEVVTIADYWTLSARRHAYLVVAPTLASLGEERYRKGLIDHLVDRKLQHQDVQIRLLASQGLAKLVELPSEQILAHLNSVVIPKLIARALEGAEAKPGTAAATPSAGGGLASGTVQSRHGAVAGVAAVTEALQELVTTENQTSIRNLVPALEKVRAYRGRGGEVVRQAACKLLGAVAGAVSWPFKDATSARYLQTVDECARHATDAIQVAAADALCALARHRFSSELGKKALGAYIEGLRKADEPICGRRGHVLCIGSLPPAVLRDQCSDVLALLSDEARGLGLPGGKDQEDPQTRQQAVLSLGRACFGMLLGGEELDVVVEALEAAMQDYALDRRGDVGSWVREVAMEVIAALLQAQRQIQGIGLSFSSPETSTRLTALLLQQAVEKIDRLRERAFGLLCRLFCHAPPALGSGVDMAYRRVCHGEAYDLLSGDESGVGSDVGPGPGGAPTSAPSRAWPPSRPGWPPAHRDRLAAALQGVATVRAKATDASAGNTEVEAPIVASTAEKGSMAVFDALVPLLGCEAYRAAVCSGLVVSVGGITEHIAKDAQRALLRYLQEGDAPEARVDEVAAELLRIFDQVGTKDSSKEARRVLVPLLSTAGILLAEGCFPRGRAGELLERATAAVRSSKDISRLRASVAVLVGLLRWPGPVRRRALSSLLEFLGYSFPTVRQATAQALYIRLLEEEGDLDITDEETHTVPADRVAEVSELMSTTPWGTDNEEALVSALRKVYGKLGLELPAGGRSMMAPKKPQETTKPRENEYADLVRENHY